VELVVKDTTDYLIVSQWLPWLMTSNGRNIVMMSTFHYLIKHGAACGAGNVFYPFRTPDFISGFHRGACCPVICVSLFHVIVLSIGFWVLIVPSVWLLGIYIFYFIYLPHHK